MIKRFLKAPAMILQSGPKQ